MNQLAESHYASSKREPLGKSIVRNYKFSEVVKKDFFLNLEYQLQDFLMQKNYFIMEVY